VTSRNPLAAGFVLSHFSEPPSKGYVKFTLSRNQLTDAVGCMRILPTDAAVLQRCLVIHGGLPLLDRGLHDEGDPLERWVVHDPLESLHRDGAPADVLVPVPVAVEGRLGVVEVHALSAKGPSLTRHTARRPNDLAQLLERIPLMNTGRAHDLWYKGAL